MIDVEFIDTELDCNTLLGHSCMYSMKEFMLYVFHIMLFRFNRKVVTLNEIIYYDPHESTNPKNVLPIVGKINLTHYVEIGLGLYKYYNVLGAYLGPTPEILTSLDDLMSTIFSSKSESPHPMGS